MKTKAFILGLASCLSVTIISCDRDGNTGNGANDPTDQFESDKVKKNGDFYGRNANKTSDTMGRPSSTPNILDTTKTAPNQR